MEIYRDDEIAIWACRLGNSADVVEFPLDAPRPIDQACASHGDHLIRSCPNMKCRAPTFHPSDLERTYHHCGEKIPWAEQRSGTARAMMEHDPFNSKFVGRPKPQRGLFESLLDTTFAGSAPRELSPQERQDMITPPSGRLPAERARPPVSRQAEGQSPPFAAQEWLERATRAEKETLPKGAPLRPTGTDVSAPRYRSEEVWVPPPSTKIVTPPRWKRGLSRMGLTAWMIALGAAGSLLAAFLAWYFGWFR